MPDATDAPQVLGPLRGGKFGWPFGGPDLDLAERGYVMEEFIISGTAESLRITAGASATDDGYWSVEPHARERYVTRAVVVRPVAAADFNGVAVVNWQNVTAGHDLGAPMTNEFYRGYAWVGVTAQKIGVDGVPGQTQGLTSWDPERYGRLSHPGDAFSYDMFSQAGRLVRGATPNGGSALLGPLRPSTVLAAGASQSAMRLGSYLNAAHQRHRVYDGFLLTVHWGICPPLAEVPLMAMFQATPDGAPSAHLCAIRDDGGVPILNLATECEARFNYPVRQPETDTFRFWEVAGAAHQSPSAMAATAGMAERDGLIRLPPPADRNRTEWRYVSDAALRALVHWARDGIVPRSHPRLEFAGGVVARDALGNALGGIRVPEAAAPVAANRGERSDDPSQPDWLMGMTTPLSDVQLAALYVDAADRQRQWHAAVDALAEAQLVLPEDVAAVKANGSR